MHVIKKNFIVFYPGKTILKVSFSGAQGFYFRSCQSKARFIRFLNKVVVTCFPVFSYYFYLFRQENPDGILLANVSALTPYEQVLRAVEMIEADGVQLHLNVLQELLMPEGDRDFKGTLENIAQILVKCPVPVIVKEVGFGISQETALKLIKIGVAYLDIGGYGGTNFALIESLRNHPPQEQTFKTWGIPTAASLLEVKSLQKPLQIIATGGIQTGLEICKALRLGANMVGIAGLFLTRLMLKGEEELSSTISNLLRELKITMLLCGARNLTDLNKVPLVFSGELLNWIRQRKLKVD
jgi:isopentenyl-diphosphate delta-isomerase